jgi:ferrous iron transport protein B
VPLIVGFGCNVPGIMAARTLDSSRDRLLTILMAPFMSCSARLAIYAVFVAAFFPTGGQNIVFSLYLIGILMAVLTGFMLRKTRLGGEAAPLVLELPAYHRPTFKRLCKETSSRLLVFIKRAGRMIVPVCIILGALNALTLDGGLSEQDASVHSLLSYLGQWLTPLFSPMGLTSDNWPATVGLLTGMLAKEVVIGSLNTLYAQLGHVSSAMNVDFNFKASMLSALWSIPHNLADLGRALLNPILASAPDSEVSQSVYGMMAKRFDGKAGAYAYMLFILLYIPCVSTMAVIRQEASRQWMYFSLVWSLLLAYVMAVLFYQLARFGEHPELSIFWIVTMLSLLGGFIALLRFWSISSGGQPHATANP